MLPGCCVVVVYLHVPEPRACKDGNKVNKYEYEGRQRDAAHDHGALGRDNLEGLWLAVAGRH